MTDYAHGRTNNPPLTATMSLDMQSNWNAEMSLPLRVSTTSPTVDIPEELDRSVQLTMPHSKEIILPPEIISQIVSYVHRRASSQQMLWACALVSRIWYSSTIPLLYECPHLHGGNFQQFVSTVCPSKNAHIRHSSLALLVRKLDMGELVHNASKSLTARLLGRLKLHIEKFVAPQSSFAINSFAALSKCTKMKHLDLSLISTGISHKLLFQTLQHMQDLETLFFPRSSSLDENRKETPYSWPPRLRVLHLAGGIDDFFLRTQLVNVPKSLERLSIQHCSQVYTEALLNAVGILGPQLKQLTIRHPMSKLRTGVLDYIFTLCPSLEAFRVSADFVSNHMFEAIPQRHPLRILDLDCSGTAGEDVDISANDIYLAVEDGRLPDLRSVRVSARLAWTATETTRQSASDLVEILEEMDEENPLGLPTGVWMMAYY